MSKQVVKRTKDGTARNMAELEAEKRELYISGANPKRLQEVKDIIDYFEWGIIHKSK